MSTKNNFLLTQIKDRRRIINEYKQLSITYPENKSFHESQIQFHLEIIKQYHKQLSCLNTEQQTL